MGAKQVKRAVEAGTAKQVFLASDADPRVTEPVAAACAGKEIPTETGF
ncbi:MAG: ribosomal L7Ae/L30e/S12e/Gadd45 family protein, partial [Clostridiales bacterium]|nr:ribosomal L7Ae/L30e/S12e/Gadd45 family protein [Clostridiales bacterium]